MADTGQSVFLRLDSISGKEQSYLMTSSNNLSDHTINQVGERVDGDGKVTSASMSTTTINICKAFMGASSFELPWAFSQAGVLGSLVGVFVVGILSNWCFVMLGELSHMCGINRPTYPEVGRVCMGAAGEYMVWFGMAMMTVGVVGSYFLFIGQILSSVIDTPSFPQWKAVVAVAMLGALLSLFRSLKALSFTSVTGLCALFVAMVVVMHDALTLDTTPPVREWVTREPAWRQETYPLFLGGVNYLFLISTAILPIEQEMHPRDRATGGFSRAFTHAQLFATIPATIFAMISWMAFANGPTGLQGNVLTSLRPGVFTNVVKVLMAVNQLFTVPLFLVPMADAFERRVLGKDEFGTIGGEAKRNLCRFCFSLAAAFSAICVPNFGLLTGLTGAFGNNLLAFVFVPLLYFERLRVLGYWQSMCGKSRYEWSKISKLVQIMLLFIFGVSTFLLSGSSTVFALLGN